MTDTLTRAPAAASRRGVTVLLIDDQPIVGEAVRRMLQPHDDIALHCCVDPRGALERAADVEPTVVLLDLLMPDLDGLTLLGHLRRDERTRHVPIIVLSTEEEPVTKARAFELGASDYIVKLPDPIELAARVRHHSGGYIALRERNDAYRALEASQKALAHELAQAAAYVRSLLPAPVHTDELSADWRFLPSVQLGGDAFGYHWLDEEHLAVFLLDVSGHGVRSALLSTSAMNAIRSRSLPEVDFLQPAQVLAGLNRAFPLDANDGMYFTLWYGVFDRRSRQLAFATAGHPPALLVTSSGGSTRTEALGEPGLIIGMMPDAAFEQRETHALPQSRLFVFSDGAFEIARPDGTSWSIEELSAVLSRDPAGADLLPLDDVETALRSVRGGAPFEDDVSILQVRFGPDEMRSPTP
jgi:sigma-B regulation protein RsbU (phosphoserine phosphatase)